MIFGMCIGFLLGALVVNQYLKELEQKLTEQKDANEDLRNENLENKLFKDKVIRTMNAKDTIVSKHDKIKELISDYQSQN